MGKAAWRLSQGRRAARQSITFGVLEVRCLLGGKAAQLRVSGGSCLNHGYPVRRFMFAVGKGGKPRIGRLLFLSELRPQSSNMLLQGESTPDALSVEWRGQKPCEKLF